MTPKDLRTQYGTGIQLRGDVLITQENDQIKIIGKKTLLFSNLTVEEIFILKTLREGLKFSSIENFLFNKRIMKILTLLNEHHFLKANITKSELETREGRQLDWLSHFTDSPQYVSEELRKKTVLILGCGGTGSIVATHLARAGVCSFVLVDGGLVDLPDLNRQFTYFESDIGKQKVDALKEYLHRTNEKISVTSLNKKIESAEDLLKILSQSNIHLVINCADTPIGLIHAFVAKACGITNVPVLFGGVGLNDATVGPLFTQSNCMLSYAEDMIRFHELLKNHENILKASICFTNTITAAQLAFEAFKFLTGVMSSLVANQSKTLSFIDFKLIEGKQWPS